MQDHRLEHRMTQLGTNRGEDPSIGEAVDRDILRSMEHGMNKIRKLFTSPYSSQNHPSEIATKILQSLLLDAVQSLRPQNPTQINPSSVVNNITGTKGSGRGTITSTSSSEKRQRSELKGGIIKNLVLGGTGDVIRWEQRSQSCRDT